jgi:hypothetical protein
MTVAIDRMLMQGQSKQSPTAISVLYSVSICIILMTASVTSCVLNDAMPYFGDRNSVIQGISLPLLAGGCNCAENQCAYAFTQLPAKGAFYEMGIDAYGNVNRTSPKLQVGDVLRSQERVNFGTFLFVPAYKFYGSAMVLFNFSFNGLIVEKNFSLTLHFNNSVPYSGEGGHMLSFDGFDDFVVATVPLQAKLNGDFAALSLSFWVKNTKRRSGQVLISAWARNPSNSSVKWIGGRQWALFDTGNINFQVNGIALSQGTGFDIRDSNWHFVCLSWKIKSGMVDVFVDGEKKTILAPAWEPPESMTLMLGNMQLVTDIIPAQKAENDVLVSRSLEKADTTLADASLSPSFADKWHAAQTMTSSLLSNLNGGMGSPKDAGSLAGIPTSFTYVHKKVVGAFRYAMFGVPECSCAGYGAATKFAFGGYLDEFRMFNEAKDTIDFSMSMNHMYSPTMFERYQTPDSAVATNSFASGEPIKALNKLWIYWNFDYIYDFLANDALPILESLRSGLLLGEARGSIELSDTRMRSVLDNTPQGTGVSGKLGDDYYSSRMPVRAISDAPLLGSVIQFFSVYPDANFSIFKLAIEDCENQTNVLVRMENMPTIGSVFQVNQDGTIGNPILARGTIVTNSDLKIAYKGDKGLCKNGVKAFNLDGELVDKDTAADAFDIYIKDVKIIPPILSPDTPPALRFSKIAILCALYRTPVTMPNIVIQTIQNSSTMFELQALSMEKSSSILLVFTQLPTKGSLWTTLWTQVSCNQTTAPCICGEDPLDCDNTWNPRKGCKNTQVDSVEKYACLVKNTAIVSGFHYENPLHVIYSPAESFWGNDSLSYHAIVKNIDGSLSKGFNDEAGTIIVIPKTPVPRASLIFSAIPNITSGDSVNISFDISRDNIAEDSLLVRVSSVIPIHGTLLLPSRPNIELSDSQGTPHRQLSQTFDVTFEGFTKSNAIRRVFDTKSTVVKTNLRYHEYKMSGDPTHVGSSYFSPGRQNFKSNQTKASINSSLTFESVCGDLGVVQSYVEFSGYFTVERIRFMTTLPSDTFIRFVAPLNVLKGNLTTIKRNSQYSRGSSKFKNCPGSSCAYPRAYNVRQSDSEQPNVIKTESYFNNVQNEELHEYWRGFAGEGQKSTSQNAIIDFYFHARLPTKFLIIEMCGTKKSWPGLIDGGNPIDEVQGLIVTATKGGNRGVLPLGTQTLMYRTNPTFTGVDRFTLTLESIDGRVFGDFHVNVHVIKSRILGSKYTTNLQQAAGLVSAHTLVPEAKILRYEFAGKYPADLQLLHSDSTEINSIRSNLHPDASGNIVFKIGSISNCGTNDAFVSFRIVGLDNVVVQNGHNITISFTCSVGLVCDASVKQCKPCPPSTYYNEPSSQYDALLAIQIPSGYCVPCSPGFYSDSPGQSACKKCDAGFSSGPGSSICKPCETGHFSPTPGTLCTPCPPGQFQPHVAQQFCYSCGLLGFSIKNGSTQCQDCPENMHAEFERTSNMAHCTCNSGYYRLSRSNNLKLMSDQSCLPCPPGAFCAGMDLLPVPLNGFWTEVSLWSDGTAYFFQCFHRGVVNQCQGYPKINYQFNHEICKFRDTEICELDAYDTDTFLSYKKNLACAEEYSGFLCFECSEGNKLSSRNFVGACVLCPVNALGYVGIVVQIFLLISFWIVVLLGLVWRVHSISLLLFHYQLLAVLSDAGVQNSVTVDAFLKGFHLFMFDLNFIPLNCVARTGVPLFVKHVVQLVLFWGIIGIVDFRGKKMVRDATLFRIQYNMQKSKISTDGINNIDRRSLRSRHTFNDQASMDDASSVGSVTSKGEQRSWKNLFRSSEAEKSQTPVVDLMRPNTSGSSKSHNSWFSKVSAWRKQHVKAEDAKLASRKLMSTEEIDELRDEQYRIVLAISQALAVPILYNSLVFLPCLEYSDKVSRMLWIPTNQCASSSHIMMSLVGVLTALWFVVWVPGKFIYDCAMFWLRDEWDNPQFYKQFSRIFSITERKHRWWISVLTFHGPVVSIFILMSGLQPATGITAVLVWIGFKTFLTIYMRPYLMTKHNVFTFILDLHMSVVCSCALYRTNIFSSSYLAFTLDRFEVSADAFDGFIHVVAFLSVLVVAVFTIFIDCVNCRVKIPPSMAITFNVLTGKPHAAFRKILTDAWNFWQKLNRKYAKWIRPRTSLVQFGKDVQRTESRERADVVQNSILAQVASYPTDSPFVFDTIENDMGEWATSPRKVYHFINACMIRIQELETVNSKSDKILALQSKVNCALRCLINFNRLDYEDAFQRQYVTSLLNTQTTRVL